MASLTATEMAELESRAKEFTLDADNDNFKCEGSDPSFDALIGRPVEEGRSSAATHGYRITVWGGPEAKDVETVALVQDYERLLVCVDERNVIYSVVNS